MASWTGLLSRRDLLRVGAVSLAGSVLPSVRGATAVRPKADSVVFLFMAGGMTHIDSFDPKPAAPSEIRGSLGAARTILPGVLFSEVMPRMARGVRHATVLRSFSHDSNDHLLSQVHVLSGRKVPMARLTSEPNIGSVVAKLHGARSGLPGYIAVPGTTRPGPPPINLFTGGWLGGQYAPFSTGGKPRDEDFTAHVHEASEEEFNQQALTLPGDLTAARLAGRRSLRDRIETGRRAVDALGPSALAGQFRDAFAMLESPGIRGAFDLTREAAPLRDRYGRSKIGQRCLLARRLVEAGARFVMVDYGYDPEFGNLWDNHNAPTQNHPPIMDMVKLPYHVAGVDRACAALLDDMSERGLLERTLVVLLTEFGRTPRINSNGGRDHWGAAGSLLFAGGGVRAGQIIGETDAQAARPTGIGYGPADVAASIYHALGIDTTAMLEDTERRPHPVLPEGRVIPGLF